MVFLSLNVEYVAGVKEKFIQILVKDRQALFKKGTAAMGNRGERLSSTLNRMRTVGIYSQEARRRSVEGTL